MDNQATLTAPLKGSIEYKNRLLKKMMILFITIVVIPAVVIGLGANYYFMNILVDKSISSYESTVDTLRGTVEKELFETKMTAYYMYLDLELKEAITLYHDDPIRSLEAVRILRKKFENYRISSSFSNVNAIKVYGFNGSSFSFGEAYDLAKLDDSAIINSKWYAKALQEPDDFIWTGLQDGFEVSQDESSISIFRIIQDRSYSQEIGMLYVNIDAKIFNDMSNEFNYSENSKVYILDSNNKAIGSESVPKEILSLVEAHDNHYTKNHSYVLDGEGNNKYFIDYISDFDWKVVGVLPVDEVTESSRAVFKFLSIIFVLFLAVSTVIWFIVLSRVFIPIKKLTDATKEINRGDFSIQVEHNSDDELGNLTNNFNFMVAKIDTLMKEVVEENTRMKDAEYKALQAQINPHFLYNTLNSIRWMAIIQKADNIKNVIDVLARLLRNSTSKMEQFITIEEEVNNLKDYVYIQKLAYNNKFSVEYDIVDDVLSAGCLKFILQPMVENAIFHGILPKDTYGTIWVKIKADLGNIYLSIRDDGVGVTDSEIQELLRGEATGLKKFNGIGVNNVHERLQIAYGDKTEFKMTSIKGEFTQIDIKIPHQKSVDIHESINEIVSVDEKVGNDVKSNDRR